MTYSLPPEKIELSSEINKRYIEDISHINIIPRINSTINSSPILTSAIDKLKINLKSILGIVPI